MSGDDRKENPPAVGAGELMRMREAREEHMIVDVRETWERDICSLEDSLHVPLSQLPSRYAELPLDRPLILLCHHGMRSMQATAWLRQQGYQNAMNLSGGIDDWAQTCDPSMRRY